MYPNVNKTEDQETFCLKRHSKEIGYPTNKEPKTTQKPLKQTSKKKKNTNKERFRNAWECILVRNNTEFKDQNEENP